MKTFPTLTTERLTLRQLAESDVQQIFLLRSNEQINTYLNRQPSKTLEDAALFIAQIKTNSLSYWAITQIGTEKLIGTICLFDISEEHKTGEIGYELLTEYQGKGIMREAAKRVIDYAAETLQLQTIAAYTHKDNSSSTQLLQDLNFRLAESRDETDKDMILFQLNLCNS